MDKAELLERELNEIFPNCWEITWTASETKDEERRVLVWEETCFQRFLDVRRNTMPTLGSMLIFHHTKWPEGVERVDRVFSSPQVGRELGVEKVPSITSVGANIPLLNH